MKQLLLIGLIASMSPLPALAHTEADPEGEARGVIERPVAFEVVNENRSATADRCGGDGATYTVRGSLVGPAGAQAGKVDAVTLYVPGSGDGSIWHFTDVPGVDHITEMATLGHASVSIHLPGYGVSDPADGNALCLGTFADHVQQVIEQLREGAYAMARGHSPAFDRVALAGHSGGGAIAELSTSAFHGADALVVASWAGYGSTAVGSPLFVRHAVRCLTAPESKAPDGPGGWGFFFDPFEQELNGNIDPDVLAAFIAAYEQDPCGWHDDFVPAVQANSALAPTVDVPVLLATGGEDAVAPPAAVQLMHDRYERGSDDVTTLIVPGTRHLPMLEWSAPVFREGLSSWLAPRGF